jgi:hypothetical protein
MNAVVLIILTIVVMFVSFRANCATVHGARFAYTLQNVLQVTPNLLKKFTDKK